MLFSLKSYWNQTAEFLKFIRIWNLRLDFFSLKFKDFFEGKFIDNLQFTRVIEYIWLVFFQLHPKIEKNYD